MITMTLREALKIQAEQIAFYSRYRADLAQVVASKTDIAGRDLDIPMSTPEIDRLVPRGCDIEYICFSDTRSERTKGNTATPEDLKHVVCPQCKKPFTLCWNDYQDKPQTLFIRGCPSGGIYDVYIECPHCNYREDL